MPNTGEKVVQGHRVDLEAGEVDPLIVDNDLTGDEYQAVRHRQRPSLCADDADDVMGKGTPGGAEGIRASIRSISESVKNMKKKEDDEPAAEPWYVTLAVPMIVCGFLLGDAGKILFEKVGAVGVHSAAMTITCSTVSFLTAVILVPCICGPMEGFAMALDWEAAKQYILPTMFFSTAQLFNIIQNQFLEASQRKVFAQLRIPLTAFLSKFIMGHGYSNVQWMCIVAITVAVFEFECLTKKDSLFGGDQIILGLIFCIVQNVFASLGSLIGEKVMKGGKKMPFVVQKFQFAFWELIFGVCVAAAIISPGTHLIIDFFKGNAFPGKLFMGSVPIVFERYSYLTYSPGAVTNLHYQAKYQTLLEGGEWAEKTQTLDNKFASAGWNTLADMRKLDDKHTDLVTDDEEHKFSAMLHDLEAAVTKRHHFHSLGGDRSLKPRDGTHEYEVEKDESGGKKFDLGNRHDRMILKELLESKDTLSKQVTENPFAMESKIINWGELQNSFLMMVGAESSMPDKAPFSYLGFQRRSQPHDAADLMFKIGVPMNDDALEYVANPDKASGAGGAKEYFQLLKEESAEDLEGFTADTNPHAAFMQEVLTPLVTKAVADANVPEAKRAALVKDILDDVPAPENLDEASTNAYTSIRMQVADKIKEYALRKGNEKKEATLAELTALLADTERSGDSVGEKSYIGLKAAAAGKKTEGDIKASVYAWPAFHSLTSSGSRDLIYRDTSFVYKKAVRYNDKKNALTLVYTRDKVRNFRIKKAGMLSAKSKKGTQTTSKGLRLTFSVEKKIHFQDGMYSSKKTVLTLANVERFADSSKKAAFTLSENFGDMLKKKRDGKKTDEAENAINAAFGSLSAESKRSLITKQHADVFDKAAADSTNGLYQNHDDLDANNAEAKFAVSRGQFAEWESRKTVGQPAEGAKPALQIPVYTFPGKYGSGIDSGKTKGCTKEMCNLSPAEWATNFRFYDWIFPAFKTFFRPPYHSATKDANDYQTYSADPFEWATYHGVTRSPMPFVFMTNPWLAVAIFCNVCQNWFSTLLSKTLSSLWKNIFAAVALACVILLDKFLLTDSVKLAETEWDRVVLAMSGVLVTVMLFNLVPKEKPAEKK